MAGEERAHEVWLRNRSRYAALHSRDMRPQQLPPTTIAHVNTELPPEVLAEMDEDEVGELGGGAE